MKYYKFLPYPYEVEVGKTAPHHKKLNDHKNILGVSTKQISKK